jgi:hypothetical protein
MKDTSLISFVKKHIEDDYAMNVFYYSVKKTFIERNYSLYGFSSFFIDGRFLGESLKVTSNANYRTPLHALGCLMSIRLLMINHKYIKLCDDDSLIVVSKPRETFQWVSIMSLILDNWDDSEVKMLYQMIENYYYDEEFSEEEKDEFQKTVVAPEYKNEKAYYKHLAQKTTGVSDCIIGNNAFLEAKFKKYSVSKDIAYVGNTAFAYCDELEALEFEGKTMFGTFPIIECNNLRQIIVPDGLQSYYAGCLPYYKALITEKQHSNGTQIKETNSIKAEEPRKDTGESEVEHVYVDIPSADSYTEIEVPIQEKQAPVTKEEARLPIDEKILQKVFDKVASSYKFFWLMAIISLAKEKHHLTLSFDDITIRMAAMAWPIVFEDDIDLGSGDIMKNHLENVIKHTKLIKGATSNVVENYLKQHYSSQGVDIILAPLMKNVPYRFLSPWIKYTTDAEVIEKSCAKSFNGLYAIHSKYIVLDEEWWEYIDAHYLEVSDFAMRSFIAYAKKYNNDMKLVKLMTTGWQLIKNT